MRNELIDLYKLACANPQDKDIVRAYQSARDRIGPQIAIHEALDNDALRARVARLEEVVQRLLDNDPNEQICDSGITVLCAWRVDARRALEEK